MRTHLPYHLDLRAALDDLERGLPSGSTARAVETQTRSLVRAIDEVDPQAPALGVDLERRLEDVRRLTYRYGGAVCDREGWDVEELIHDVVVAIAIRNRGVCPFDSRKGAFSSYVVRVVRQEVSRRLRREKVRVTLVPESVVVDDVEFTPEVAGDRGEYEGRLDLARAWAGVVALEPAFVTSLVESAGSVAEAARHGGHRPRDIAKTRACLVGACR